MKIGQKLTLGFLAVSLLVAALGLVSIYTNRQIARRSLLSEISVEGLNMAMEMTTALLAVETSARELTAQYRRAASESGAAQEARDGARRAEAAVERAMADFEQRLASERAVSEKADWFAGGEGAAPPLRVEDEAGLLDEIEAEFALHREYLRRHATLARSDIREAEAFYDNVLHPQFRNKLLPLITRYGSYKERELKADAAEIRQALAREDRLMILSTAAALGLAVCFGLYFSRAISNPLAALSRSAVEVGRGRLDVRLPYARRDETGALARSFI